MNGYRKALYTKGRSLLNPPPQHLLEESLRRAVCRASVREPPSTGAAKAGGSLWDFVRFRRFCGGIERNLIDRGGNEVPEGGDRSGVLEEPELIRMGYESGFQVDYEKLSNGADP